MEFSESIKDGGSERDGTSEAPSTLRFAVISSQRSGNTWLRQMIAGLYGLEEMPVHFPESVPWDDISRRCVLQIHWNPEPDFKALLERHGFRVVVIARHPFDLLLSYLNYAYYVHQEGLCRAGGCSECVLVGACPREQRFLDYVGSEYGELLLEITPRWWKQPDVIRFRYEDLVADPETQLRRFVEEIGEAPVKPIAEVIEANSIRQLKPNREIWHYHIWQGRPGLWRSMIPKAEAEWLASRRPEFFDVVGYPLDPDPSLEPLQADLNWLRLQLSSTREHLGLERAKHLTTLSDLDGVRNRLDALKEQLEVAERCCVEKDEAYAQLLRQHNDLTLRQSQGIFRSLRRHRPSSIPGRLGV